MKNISLILLITCVFVVTSCTQQDLFTKKSECAKYISIVKKEAQELKTAEDPEVFYSSKLDACLATFIVHSNAEFVGQDNRYTYFKIKNLLTNEKIFDIIVSEEDEKKMIVEGKNMYRDFENEVNKFK